MTQPADLIPAATAPAAAIAGAGGAARVPLPGEQPPSPTFVRLAVLIALGLTMVTVGLVGWRWLMVRFPNAALIARGDESADGVEIVVRGDDGRELARG